MRSSPKAERRQRKRENRAKGQPPAEPVGERTWERLNAFSFRMEEHVLAIQRADHRSMVAAQRERDERSAAAAQHLREQAELLRLPVGSARRP